MWIPQPIFIKDVIFMFFVDIDVAKDKHDCLIFNSNGEVVKEVLTFSKDLDGFNLSLASIPNPSENLKWVLNLLDTIVLT